MGSLHACAQFRWAWFAPDDGDLFAAAFHAPPRAAAETFLDLVDAKYPARFQVLELIFQRIHVGRCLEAIIAIDGL